MLKATTFSHILLIEGSTYIPKIRSMIKERFNASVLITDLPQISGAYGTATLGGTLSGNNFFETLSIVLLDISPLSIGIEYPKGEFLPIIPRNSFLPTRKSVIIEISEPG